MPGMSGGQTYTYGPNGELVPKWTAWIPTVMLMEFNWSIRVLSYGLLWFDLENLEKFNPPIKLIWVTQN
jgi:hypothetical protein